MLLVLITEDTKYLLPDTGNVMNKPCTHRNLGNNVEKQSENTEVDSQTIPAKSLAEVLGNREQLQIEWKQFERYTLRGLPF